MRRPPTSTLLPYTTLFRSNINDQTGAYSLLYLPVQASIATPLVADVPVSDTLSPIGDLDLFTFSVPISTRVVLQATSSAFNACLRIWAADPATPLVAIACVNQFFI